MKNFVDKDLVNLPESYEDERGFIQPLCDLNMKSASLIISKKNTWRANPESSVSFTPNRDPNQPPIKFVKTPISS